MSIKHVCFIEPHYLYNFQYQIIAQTMLPTNFSQSSSKTTLSNKSLNFTSPNLNHENIFQQYINENSSPVRYINEQSYPSNQSEYDSRQSTTKVKQLQQQTQTLVICDASHFDTFNQGPSHEGNSHNPTGKTKKRLRLWSTGSVLKAKKKQQQEQYRTTNIQERQPLSQMDNNAGNERYLHALHESSEFQRHIENKKSDRSISNDDHKLINHFQSMQESVKCSCQEFDKLLEISSRCVDYYNTFAIEKDQELKIVKEAFVQIEGNLLSAFKSIIDEIKLKQSEIISFLRKKQHELFGIKDRQEQKLKQNLQEIRGVHLANFLMRNSNFLGDKAKNSLMSLEQSLENSKVVNIAEKSVSEDIQNYAKTLHNFYETMEEIQKNSFKENVDETINFINNLITEEIKFIVYEKIPQKSMNCSFSFNNNSADEGRFHLESKKNSMLPYFENINSLSISSPSIGTKIEFSEPTSPKGLLEHICGEQGIKYVKSTYRQQNTIQTQTESIYDEKWREKVKRQQQSLKCNITEYNQRVKELKKLKNQLI